MTRKLLLLAAFSLLLAAESVYFARACAAGVMRLRAEHAFYRNDHRNSWRLYRQALAWGGDRERLETDTIELILFGLDQTEVGIRVDMALPPKEAVRLARDLITRRIREAPRRAYYWSLASDIYGHEGRQRRREIPLDLATLSEDPLQNLLPEQRLSLAALQTAARLEPNNYLYHDLLVEALLELGSPERAAHPCRMAVAAYPDFDGHSYLLRSDLAPALLESAVQGFEDALRGRSMILPPEILVDAGRLLTRHGQVERATDYFDRALVINPDDYDARMGRGVARYRLKDLRKAMEDFERASTLSPERPSPHYFAGVARRAQGDLEGAILEFRRARERGFGEIKIFHALGEALEAAGQIGEAERQFVAAANLHPKAPDAWSFLLAFHMRHGNNRAASEVCSRIVSLDAMAGVSREQCARLGEEFR